jgi:Rrf2 family nitric oxide-sensitive transcriptional repressor
MTGTVIMRVELTRSTDYAVRAMLALARQPGDTLSSTDISSQTQIPVRFVTQVMSHLVRAGLVRGVIGRTGGYRLAAEPGSVSVLTIVRAVEGDNRRQTCALRGGPCIRGEPCEIHDVLAAAHEAFIGRLAEASLAAVAARPADGSPPSRCSRAASPGRRRPVRGAAG